MTLSLIDGSKICIHLQWRRVLKWCQKIHTASSTAVFGNASASSESFWKCGWVLIWARDDRDLWDTEKRGFGKAEDGGMWGFQYKMKREGKKLKQSPANKELESPHLITLLPDIFYTEPSSQPSSVNILQPARLAGTMQSWHTMQGQSALSKYPL